MKQFACRRGFKVDINDSETRTEVECRTTEPINAYSLFPNCIICGYGRKHEVLVSRTYPFDTYEVKTCKMRIVV